MTDKEKIRKEVERLQKELVKEKEKGLGSDVDDACILELQNVLTYIDSLQEEPVSKDLEGAVKKYLTSLRKSHFEGYDIERAFKKGAQWQTKQMIKDSYTGIYDCCDDTSWIEFKGWLLSTSEVGEKVKLVIIKEE